MSYIRTKNGIYKVIKNELFGECIKIDGGYIMLDNIYDYVIDRADTIQKLCDEFVLYDNQLKTHGVFDKKIITFKWLQNNLEIYKGMTIYGAIWTDKGLIYVAKMNETGELVLI